MTVWLRVPLPAAVLVLLIVAGPASAASTPTVGGLVPDPATIQTRASTPVKVTIAIPDPRVITTVRRFPARRFRPPRKSAWRY